jgi:hypothetical protein
MKELIKKMKLDVSQHENREAGVRLANAVAAVGNINHGVAHEYVGGKKLLCRHHYKKYHIDLD